MMEQTPTDVAVGARDNFILSANILDIFTNEMVVIFKWIFYQVLTGTISIFGTITNIINIVCFVQQGFNDAINISCLGLAVSELCGLVLMIWVTICYNPSLGQLDLPFEPLEVEYLTGGWPHITFTRITSWITAFIGFERCLCVTRPFKVRIILTYKRVAAINVCIYVIIIANTLPVYFVNKLALVFSPKRNRTIIGLTFIAEREQLDAVLFPINHIFLQFFAFFIICLCVSTLVGKMRHQSNWRTSFAGTIQDGAVSSREKRATKMVVVISMTFIICLLPFCFMVAAMMVEPELSVAGKYRNVLTILSSVAFFLESANSAISMFVYYHTSSKYRRTLRHFILQKKAPPHHT